jgi:HEAT repeat protein
VSRSPTAVRVAAAERLGDRCNGHPEEVDDALPELLGMLADEDDPAVLEAIAGALGHMWDPRCLQPLLGLTAHPERDVRLAATQGLGGALCNAEDPDGVEALVKLTADTEPAIRDWATFTLAQLEADSDSIRAALWQRVGDREGDTCGEALVGLARRKDASVYEEIERHMRTDAGNLIVEAAAELGDAGMYPLLVELQERGWQKSDNRPEVLDWALESCRPASDGDAER